MPHFDHQHRTSRRTDDPLGGTPQKKSRQPGAPVAPHCHQSYLFFFGRRDDLFKGTTLEKYRLQRYAMTIRRCFQVLQNQVTLYFPAIVSGHRYGNYFGFGQLRQMDYLPPGLLGELSVQIKSFAKRGVSAAGMNSSPHLILIHKLYRKLAG